ANAQLIEALARQNDSAPRLRQAFDEQATLTHLGKDLGDAERQKLTAEQTSVEGRTQLGNLLDQQQQVATRLEQIAEQLQHSAALAPLSEAWNAYRDRLQQLMLIGNRLNQGQRELAQLQTRVVHADQQ
ncbi:chromosome segregation protein SMC, partial [Pseudomonas gingeri]|nr:chromosome segregation protein SMC [Pseudomonas gingeri]